MRVFSQPDVSRLENCGDEPRPSQHKYTQNFKLNNWAISDFPDTRHIFKPLLNAVLYFQNVKNQHNVWFQFLISQRIFPKKGFSTQRLVSVFDFTENFPQKRIFNTKFGFSFPLSHKIFRLQFSLIFLRKNRSEVLCVSSENILHLTEKVLAKCGKRMTSASTDNCTKQKTFSWN